MIYKALLFVSTCCVASSQILLSVSPARKAYEAGQDVVLTCNSLLASDALEWKWGNRTIARGTQITVPQVQGSWHWYTVHQTDSESSSLISVLTVHNAQVEDGGLYSCEDPDDPGISPKVSRVVVLASTCTMSPLILVENATAHMSCQVWSSGPWKPHMECSGPLVTHAQSRLIQDGQTSLTKVSISRRLIAEMHGAVYSCRTFFTEPADRPLEYNSTYTFQALDVQYSPRGVSIHPQKEVYQPGDIVHCSAAGRPTPTFEWRDEKRVEEGYVEDRCKGASLLITDHMEGHRSFSCVATNVIHNQPHHARLTHKLFVHQTKETPQQFSTTPPKVANSEALCVLPPPTNKTKPEVTTTVQPATEAQSDSREAWLGLHQTPEKPTDKGIIDSTYEPRILPGMSRPEPTSYNLILPLSIAGAVLLVAIAAGLIYWGTKYGFGRKYHANSAFNLDNDMYLSTSVDTRNCVSAQPNQYAMARKAGLLDNDDDNDDDEGLPEKKNTDDYDDGSSGFYSELVLPDEEPSPSSPEPPALRPGSALVGDGGQVQQYTEDGYLMPTMDSIPAGTIV